MSYFPHFLRPDWLWAFLPLFFLECALILSKNKSQHWHRICDRHLLPFLLKNTQRNQKGWWGLLALSWTCAVIALAGPSWTPQVQTVYRDHSARVILLDLSSAMNSADIAPSRWIRARYKVQDILNQRPPGQTGLIAFTSEPYTVSPLTQDTKTIAALLNDLNPNIMPVSGSRIDRALTWGVNLLKQSGATQGDLLLLSSGPISAEDIQTAYQIKNQGYRISVLAVGTTRGAPAVTNEGNYVHDEKGAIIMNHLDTQGLKDLPQAGGGAYLAFSDDHEDIQRWLALTTINNESQPVAKHREGFNEWPDQGYWLLLGLLPLALLGFWRMKGSER